MKYTYINQLSSLIHFTVESKSNSARYNITLEYIYTFLLYVLFIFYWLYNLSHDITLIL